MVLTLPSALVNVGITLKKKKILQRYNLYVIFTDDMQFSGIQFLPSDKGNGSRRGDLSGKASASKKKKADSSVSVMQLLCWPAHGNSLQGHGYRVLFEPVFHFFLQGPRSTSRTPMEKPASSPHRSPYLAHRVSRPAFQGQRPLQSWK